MIHTFCLCVFLARLSSIPFGGVGSERVRVSDHFPYCIIRSAGLGRARVLTQMQMPENVAKCNAFIGLFARVKCVAGSAAFE